MKTLSYNSLVIKPDNITNRYLPIKRFVNKITLYNFATYQTTVQG